MQNRLLNKSAGMMENELHIFEERPYLFWALVILICTAGGTYVLIGSFFAIEWSIFNIRHLAAIILFMVSFIGIFKISDPLYHFIFYFKNDRLIIKTKKGKICINNQEIPVQIIDSLKFDSYYPRSSSEALFDYSTTFHLMWKKQGKSDFERILNPDAVPITLKVHDIARIVRFIRQKNPEISVPDQQASYLDLL